MCDGNCIAFGVESLTKEEVEGKRILDVGSCNVNGGLRPSIISLNPSEYMGVDIVEGPGVDMVCSSDDILDKFGENSFDVVISTCVLEHVENWKLAISNMKKVCKPNGILLIIVPSVWPWHNHPHDYWRYSKKEMEKIFSDFDVKVLKEEESYHGPHKIGNLVYMKAVKPVDFHELNLEYIDVYSLLKKGYDMKPLADIYMKYPATRPGSADKGSIHSYISVYEDLLTPYRKCKKVLEIGILAGQSLKMWEEYFSEADVYGVDITDADLKPMIASGKHRISIFNACDPVQVEKHFKDNKFDVIIEDASHALHDQLLLYKNFKKHIAENGIYIIEDVDKIDQVRPQFLALDPDKVIRVIDRRLVKHRFDDVLVVIGGIQNQKAKFDYINNMFNHLCAAPTDMKTHMPRILKYACQAPRIVEFGVWDCTSTWGLLTGKPKWMRSYDIVRLPQVNDVERITKDSGIDFKFVKQSTLEATIEECDLLFIDSYHSYDQLKKELQLHAGKVKKWIMFHDTTTFGDVDQTPQGARGTGKGLWLAITEFLVSHPGWKLLERHMDCNGLTIIQRA